MTDVDIRTGKPSELAAEERRIDQERREKERLKLQSSMFGISGTEGGQKLIALVKSLLVKRIDKVLQDDPEAKAYLEILNSIGFAEKFAQEAVKKITERALRK